MHVHHNVFVIPFITGFEPYFIWLAGAKTLAADNPAYQGTCLPVTADNPAYSRSTAEPVSYYIIFGLQFKTG
ncbi:hypothetical protein DDV23_02240 [Streptococcus chenjunshii]|uniref:Uncharacterized protein n=1 Tax=Streptococcus chenjunshii TaxID=2173853 RepID=A0A372KNN9_9STRE|nr:hypothetical protein DDV22_01740 [Streptococcus chenjunshii]RFU53911.1 hypothetical protein DDV23_02240 [Streptococcus chenjunshii]